MSAVTGGEVLRSGTRFLGKYRIGKVLGTGTSAVVYEAADQFLDEPVALKLIPRSRLQSADHVERVRREVKLLRRLRHPNLVAVHDAGFTENYVFVAMEKLEGATLRAILTALGSLTVSEGLAVGLQIANAIAVAHQVNAVHRDLKPDNVMLLPGNRVKIFDFGVAKYLGYGHSVTEDCGLRGTLLYMAPEQLLRMTPDTRVDVYALGTLLYEALAGQHFIVQQNPRTERDVADAQIYFTPPLLSDQYPQIPRPVATVIAKMMDKSAARRPRDMGEVAVALDRAQKQFERWAKRRRVVPSVRDLAPASGWIPEALRPVSQASGPVTEMVMTATVDRASSRDGKRSAQRRTLRLDEYHSPERAPLPSAPPPGGHAETRVPPTRVGQRSIPVRSLKLADDVPTRTRVVLRPPPADPSATPAPPVKRRRGRRALVLTVVAGLIAAVPLGVLIASVRRSLRQEAVSVGPPARWRPSDPVVAPSAPAVAPLAMTVSGVAAIPASSASERGRSAPPAAAPPPSSRGAISPGPSPRPRTTGAAVARGGDPSREAPAVGLDRAGPLFTTPFIEPEDGAARHVEGGR